MGDKEIEIFDGKSIVDGGNGEKKPFSLERKELALKEIKEENNAKLNFSK